MAFKVPEKYRAKRPKKSPMYSDESYGNNGLFEIPMSRKQKLNVIASDGGGWDHVSVSLPSRIPTYYEMQRVRNLFWGPNDVVVEYRLGSGKNINIHENCLHMWCPQNKRIQLPPEWMV